MATHWSRLVSVSILFGWFISCSLAPSDLVSSQTLRPFQETKVRDQLSELIESASKTEWTITERQSGFTNAAFISFISESEGWVSDGSSIRSTTDAGSTWQIVSVSLPNKSYISGLFLFKQNKAVIIAKSKVDNYYFGPSTDSHAWILITNDAGKTWEKAFDSSSIELHNLTAISDGTCLIDGEKFRDPKDRFKNSEYFLMKSVDFGKTWTNLAPLRVDEKIGRTQENSDTPGAVEIISPSHFRVISHFERVLFESSNGGMSWQKAGRYLHDDPQVGVRNLGKKDDGSEWMFESTYSIEGVRSRIKTVSTNNQFTRWVLGAYFLSDIYYLGGNSFIVSGRFGNLRRDQDRAVILITDNDGQSWTTLYRSEQIGGFNSMFQVSPNLFWAISDGGKMIRIQRKG